MNARTSPATVKQRRVRMTVDLPVALNNLLEDIANEQGLSKADILRKAVAMYDVAHQATTEPEKKKVAIVDQSGNILREIVGI